MMGHGKIGPTEPEDPAIRPEIQGFFYESNIIYWLMRASKKGGCGFPAYCVN